MYALRFVPALALVATTLAAPGTSRALTRPYVPTIDVEAGSVFLSAPERFIAAPGGSHLYLTGSFGVVGIARDPLTGTVRLLERRDVEPSTLSVGAGALSVDGVHLYVPSLTIGLTSGAHLSILARDALSGLLMDAGGVTVTGGATAVAVSPDDAHVYVVGAGLSVFARDAGTGLLTPVQDLPVTNPSDVVLSPDGAHVYVLRAAEDAVSIFARDAGSGTLTPAGSIMDGVGGIDGLAGVAALRVSADGAHAYAAGESEDAVAVLARDPATGMLTLVETQREGVAGVSGLVGPNGLTLSSDDAHVYVAASGSPGSVVAFARDALTGALTLAGVLSNGAVVEGLAGPAVTLSPDDAHLYVSGSATIAVLARAPLTGTTTFVQRRTGLGGGALRGARALVPASDGTHVYVGAQDDRAIAIYGVSSIDGALLLSDAVYQGEQPGLSAVAALGISPDASHVYAASSDIDSLAVYARTAGTGALTFLESHVEGVGGVAGLDDPEAITLSADGRHVYVAGRATSSVAVFRRDVITGLLVFVEVQTDGGGVAGLADPRAVVVSGNGLHVYVASATGEIAIFDRNIGSGALTFKASVADGDPGVHRLAGARDLVLTADGTNLIVAAEDDDAITVFERDVFTGVLTVLDVIEEVDGIGPLTAPTALTLHPDGATLLVVASAIDFGSGSLVASQWTFDRAADGTLSFVNVAPLRDVIRAGRFGPGDDAYFVQIGFGLRLYRSSPGFVGCDATPRVDCKALGDGRSKLVLNERVLGRGILKWKWGNGERTVGADFGDPMVDGVAWCLYDESTGPPVLSARALAPGDTIRWRSASATKVKYKDKSRMPEGILAMVLKTVLSTGVPKLKVKGSGSALAMPRAPLDLPLRVQLQTPEACWEATYSSFGVKRNELGQFIGSAD